MIVQKKAVRLHDGGHFIYVPRMCIWEVVSFWCRDWSLAAVMEIQSLERIQSSWRSPACATWCFSDRVSANVPVCGRCGYCDNIRCSTLGADRRWTVLPVGSTATNNTDHPLVGTQDPRGSTTDKKSFLEGRNRLVGSLPSIVDKYECRRSSRGHLHLPRATELQRLSIFHSGARCRRHSFPLGFLRIREIVTGVSGAAKTLTDSCTIAYTCASTRDGSGSPVRMKHTVRRYIPPTSV